MTAIIKSIVGLIRTPPPDGRLTTFADRYRIAVLISWLFLPTPFLLRLFGSDKQRPGEHSYGGTYNDIVSKYRSRRLTLLEIGILSGDSLLAWRAVLPLGRIVGCDIDSKAHLQVGALHIHQADQSAATDLRRIIDADGPFDIIIDDGSHHSPHQVFSFRYLFPSLKMDGVYVIEDVQTSYWPVVPGGCHFTEPGFSGSCVGFFLHLTKYLNHAEFWSDEGVEPELCALAREIASIRFEHNMIVIRKGRNTEPSNFLDHIRQVTASGQAYRTHGPDPMSPESRQSP